MRIRWSCFLRDSWDFVTFALVLCAWALLGRRAPDSNGFACSELHLPNWSLPFMGVCQKIHTWLKSSKNCIAVRGSC